MVSSKFDKRVYFTVIIIMFLMAILFPGLVVDTMKCALFCLEYILFNNSRGPLQFSIADFGFYLESKQKLINYFKRVFVYEKIS